MKTEPPKRTLSTSATVGDPDPRVTAILEQYMEQIERGTPRDVEALLAQHPDGADSLRGCLASLDFLFHASTRIRTRIGADAASEGPAVGSRRLGDYRIIREVGRGGTGVVYEAEQISLGRRVALKVLPFAAVLDSRQLQRFKNEAMAAAQLDHGNILSVHAVGCERGVHFYAMQFIDGPTLADVIHDLKRTAGSPHHPDGGAVVSGGDAHESAGTQVPADRELESSAATVLASSLPLQAAGSSAYVSLTPDGSTKSPEYFQAVARLGIQAAEALDHAHAHGIVHRDIKPSNLLLDNDGTLWVTDFGLAQCQTDTGVSLTQPGDLLGTLRYMSPEQALAKRVPMDHRTDIYSLGVTLYELLTLTPAITGQDRHELLRKIADEEPTAPRRLNAALPADLETIILKASAKDAPDRYKTAQALADDLERFLEHKPILAKRPTLVERTAKWSRRHRGVVAASFVVLLCSTVALAVAARLFWQEQAKTAAALQIAIAERNAADQQRALVESTLQMALNAVGGIVKCCGFSRIRRLVFSLRR